MPALETVITGVAELQRAFPKLADQILLGAERALREEAEVIKTESQQLVPVAPSRAFVKLLRREGFSIRSGARASGTLRGSAIVHPVTQDSAGRLSVSIGYGGASVPYAYVQHEDLYWSKRLGALIPKRLHHWIGEAKYLEKPFLARTQGMTARIAATIAARLGLLRL